MKADLLVPAKAPFLDLARHGVCADVRSRLFVIDQVLVLCNLQDSIAGPMKNCPVPGYQDMFEIIIQHIDQADLGLGPGHDVQRLPL